MTSTFILWPVQPSSLQLFFLPRPHPTLYIPLPRPTPSLLGSPPLLLECAMHLHSTQGWANPAVKGIGLASQVIQDSDLTFPGVPAMV